MKLLKNRGFAALVMALLICGGVLVGSHRPLSRLVAGAEAEFYSNGIQSCLDDRIASAHNLATVAGRALDSGDARIAAVLAARQELADAQTPHAKFEANRKLSEAAEELYRALKDTDLAEKDVGYPDRIHADLLASEDIIGRDGYNRLVEECRRTLAQFPANLLAPLTGVQPPEYYR